MQQTSKGYYIKYYYYYNIIFIIICLYTFDYNDFDLSQGFELFFCCCCGLYDFIFILANVNVCLFVSVKTLKRRKILLVPAMFRLVYSRARHGHFVYTGVFVGILYRYVGTSLSLKGKTTARSYTAHNNIIIL